MLRKNFRLPKDNLLDLFDSNKSPDKIDQSISNFLETQQNVLFSQGRPARDLLLYYVGHGGFTPGDRQYFLAIRSTRQGHEGASALRMTDLANTIRRRARDVRKYLILDCCFAASAFKEFQSSGVGEALQIQTMAEFPDDLPSRGTGLLCASSRRDVALTPEASQLTMFSDALLAVLRNGDPNLGPFFSLDQLGQRTAKIIKQRHPHDAVRPQVVSPDQSNGDVARVLLFPNVAFRQGEKNSNEHEPKVLGLTPPPKTAQRRSPAQIGIDRVLNAKTRESAVFALADIIHDHRVRQAQSKGITGPPVGELIEHELRTQTDVEVRRALGYALYKGTLIDWGEGVLTHEADPQTRKALLVALADSDEEVRNWGAVILGYMGEVAAQPVLEKLVSSEKEGLATYARNGLLEIRQRASRRKNEEEVTPEFPPKACT